MTPRQLRNAIDEAEAVDDDRTLKQLEKRFQRQKGPPPLPFQPALRFAPSVKGKAAKGETAIELANRLSRARRAVAYRRKLKAGYQGPIIVAEGDSWFEYPILLDDLIDQLTPKYAVLSLAGAGHLLKDMLTVKEFVAAIKKQKADYFLLSGGGNDLLLKQKLYDFLKPYDPKATAEEHINHAVFDPFAQSIFSTYFKIIDLALKASATVKILIHGYDYPLPVKKGPWLGEPLTRRGIPFRVGVEIVRIIMDHFNEGLATLATHDPRVKYIDCRNSVDPKKGWHDELHPTNAGFASAAKPFLAALP